MNFYEEEWLRLKAKVGLADTFKIHFAVCPGGRDSYEIRTGREGGEIIASDEGMLLQAVYRFFYGLGVRYLGPGRQYEKYPAALDPRTLEQEVHVEPLSIRGVCIEGADSRENILDMIDWMPKIGLNSFFVQFRDPYTFLKRWYAHDGNALLAPEPFDLAAIDSEVSEAISKRHLHHHRVGHGWTGAVLGASAFGWEKEDRPLAEERRPYAALIKGKREYFGGVPLNTNLCMSNPAVQEQFADEVLQYAQDHPEVDYLHVWLADDCNNHCECENCRSKTPTDLYIRILNRIDEKLTAASLATRIVFLLYLELLWPPQTETLLHPERFVLMFAPISRSFESGYRTADYDRQIPQYERNQITLPVGVDENIAFLKAWQKALGANLPQGFAYDYHLGRAHYGDLGYMRISRLLNEDVYQMPSLQLDGMMACQELRAGFPHFLPNYVLGMTLTEPAFSFGDLEDDYFMAAYGPYAHEVMTYLETLSRLTHPDWFNGKGPRTRPDLVPDYQAAQEEVLRMRPRIAAMQSEDPVEARFLEILKYHNLFAEVYLLTMLARIQDEQTALEEAYAALDQLINENEMAFQECLDVYRIHEVMLHYTRVPTKR